MGRKKELLVALILTVGLTGLVVFGLFAATAVRVELPQLFVSFIATDPQAITATAASYTVTSLSKSDIQFTANAGGTRLYLPTGLTVATAKPQNGAELTIESMGSANTVIKDLSGRQELAGDQTLSQYDTIHLKFEKDRWIQIGASNN